MQDDSILDFDRSPKLVVHFFVDDACESLHTHDEQIRGYRIPLADTPLRRERASDAIINDEGVLRGGKTRADEVDPFGGKMIEFEDTTNEFPPNLIIRFF